MSRAVRSLSADPTRQGSVNEIAEGDPLRLRTCFRGDVHEELTWNERLDERGACGRWMPVAVLTALLSPRLEVHPLSDDMPDAAILDSLIGLIR